MTPTVNSFARQSTLHGHNVVEACCGNELNYAHLKPVRPFSREIIQGVLNILVNETPSDIVPPSRILDLRVSISNSSQVTLHWTAPGDDNDWGKSDFYEAIVSTSWEQVRNLEGEKLENLPLPLRAGLEQSHTFKQSVYDEILFVSIRAVDAKGNNGEIGNIVEFLVPHPPTTEPSVTTPHEEDVANYATESHSMSYELPVEQFEFIAMLSGSILGLFLILALILCYCYFSSKSKRTKKKTKETGPIPSIIIKAKTSSPVVSRHESSDSIDKNDEAFKEVRSLSPVQSWAPSQLLAEHERRYSVSNAHHVVDFSAPHHQSHGPSFPDVTLNCSQALYPSSRTPSTTTSDPPAYQASYGQEAYPPYPYGLHQPSFTSE